MTPKEVVTRIFENLQNVFRDKDNIDDSDGLVDPIWAENMACQINSLLEILQENSDGDFFEGLLLKLEQVGSTPISFGWDPSLNLLREFCKGIEGQKLANLEFSQAYGDFLLEKWKGVRIRLRRPDPEFK